MADLMLEGDSVVIDERGEKSSFIKLKKAATFKAGKTFVSMDALIGAPFEAMFQVSLDGKTLERLTRPPNDEVTKVEETSKNNSSLLDRNSENQKLGHEDVEAMKRAGKSGSEIIEELCSNSATFQNKTEFSQDKYKKKKAKKYIVIITCRRPTGRTLCQAYYDKGPERFSFLRWDSLAMMLNLAHICANNLTLIFDNCLGVPTAAVLERMGGKGQLCSSFVSKPFSKDAVRLLNFRACEYNILVNAQLSVLQAAKAKSLADEGAAAKAMEVDADEPATADGEDVAEAGPSTLAANSGDGDAQLPPPQQQQQQQQQQAMAADAEASTAAPNVAGDAQGAPKRAGNKGQNQNLKAGDPVGKALTRQLQLDLPEGGQLLQQMVHPGFSSLLVVAPKLDPVSLMDAVYPLLRGSASFAIFSQSPQPLAECLHQLQASKRAVNLQLQESWMRPYQVLPMRTHPFMTTSGTAGFILSGTKVTDDKDGPKTADKPAAAGKSVACSGQVEAADGKTPQADAAAAGDVDVEGQAVPDEPSAKRART